MRNVVAVYLLPIRDEEKRQIEYDVTEAFIVGIMPDSEVFLAYELCDMLKVLQERKEEIYMLITDNDLAYRYSTEIFQERQIFIHDLRDSDKEIVPTEEAHKKEIDPARGTALICVLFPENYSGNKEDFLRDCFKYYQKLHPYCEIITTDKTPEAIKILEEIKEDLFLLGSNSPVVRGKALGIVGEDNFHFEWIRPGERY